MLGRPSQANATLWTLVQELTVAVIDYQGAVFLKGFDQQVREFTCAEMERKGVNLHFNKNIERIEATPEAYNVHLTNGEVLEVDVVLATTGRKANIKDLVLEDNSETIMFAVSGDNSGKLWEVFHFDEVEYSFRREVNLLENFFIRNKCIIPFKNIFNIIRVN